MSKDRVSQFLTQMGKGGSNDAEPVPSPQPSPPPPSPTVVTEAVIHEMPKVRKTAAKGKPTKSRAELKHFGGYLDDETLEKIALLRIRLKLDNSQLIKRAIDDLARKHNAAKAFGDA